MLEEFKMLPLDLEHIEDILIIENLSFPIPWSREAWIQEIRSNKLARYIMILDKNRAIAYGGMWLILDEAHITNIAVHPDYRGKGIGKKLMQGLIDTAKREGIMQMSLEVRKSNTIAIHLYESFGFRVEGMRKEFYLDNHEDALIMWRRE
ncbi:ribosomal protein S18-alanine N-acetyltransferase [Garciella nitratireducens]|uniref:[Ribosomal protein bS18]-alanine N-acetyltransferase n=1 Tax=Garciella nitratireducens DSM 15102 TaxID=1121911 RepID=A0A1T4LZ78_9FIRM|nr:ribosomal protein S18-alanine N-acetyltransferase [Garciella nitratireducens]SJZ59951.1 ribosomal-protein-alanine N-acetyltransferase [Garciella nitratireducens DSM 15102]